MPGGNPPPPGYGTATLITRTFGGHDPNGAWQLHIACNVGDPGVVAGAALILEAEQGDSGATPPNNFTIAGKAKAARNGNSTTLTVSVPGPGRLTATSPRVAAAEASTALGAESSAKKNGQGRKAGAGKKQGSRAGSAR